MEDDEGDDVWLATRDLVIGESLGDEVFLSSIKWFFLDVGKESLSGGTERDVISGDTTETNDESAPSKVFFFLERVGESTGAAIGRLEEGIFGFLEEEDEFLDFFTFVSGASVATGVTPTDEGLMISDCISFSFSSIIKERLTLKSRNG